MTGKLQPTFAELLKASGMTQQELAEKVGLSRSYISQMQTGVRTGSGPTLRKLAAALGCTLSELLGEERRQPPKKAAARPAPMPARASNRECRAVAEFQLLQDHRRRLVADLSVVDAKLETLLRVL